MGDKTNVLFIQSQEGFGADSAVHAHLMRHLDRNRFGVHVACTAGDGSHVPESLERLQDIPDVQLRPTHFAPGFRERSIQTILKSSRSAVRAPVDFIQLRDYVRKHRIRVIHSSERPRDSVYNVALARAAGAKSVVHVHVKWTNRYSAPAKWAVNAADAIFSISKYVTSTVVDMGRPSHSIHTIHNCIDPAHWDPTTNGSTVREELDVPADAEVLASVSRLFSWKGQRELLQAFADVRKEFSNAVLLVVGADAPHEGTSFTTELKQLATELGVLEFVRFTGKRSDIPAVMAACDVYTMPSFEEPFGLVFLEAMVMGKPVVALANGGTPEVVVDGQCGLLSPPWEIGALTENIKRLLRDPEMRARMGQAGRQRVLEHFNPQRMAAEAGSAYESIARS